MIKSLLLVIVLIFLNAFFSASEMAFISLNINKLRANEDKRSAKISKIIADSTHFLSSIQVGVTLSGFLASAIASEAFSQVMIEGLINMGVNMNMEVIKSFVLVFITLILSYVTILFGELVPKKIAIAYPEQVSRIVVYPMNFFSVLSLPIVKFLAFSTRFVLRLFKIDPDKFEDSATEEEIKLLVSVSSESGNIDEVEREMIDNIFAFDDMYVEDIMTHRTEVLALSEDWTFEEVIKFVSNERYTRYPVFKDNLDNVIGTIHLRDLLKYTYSDQEYHLHDILRKPYYVPTSKKTDELFNEFKLNKTHIAIVVDEYGGTAGIITMEDLIEEIMGDISDEYDEDESLGIIQISDEMWIVDGDSELYDLEESLGVDLPVDKFDTVSGFIISELGRLPETSDLNSLESAIVYDNFRFIITKADEKVVTKVRVIKIKTIEDSEEE